MINSNLFLILAPTYVKLLDNDVIAKGLLFSEILVITSISLELSYVTFLLISDHWQIFLKQFYQYVQSMDK
jgi:hypothetical protein